jgi:UDP-N-acetylglucosamine 1-carboxyvinyltransferase
MKSKQHNKTNVGVFIKKLREERGMTQAEFAEELGTSQSAVARFESGEQNMTLENLNEISRVLGRRIVNPSDSIDFQIEGGRELSGSIKTNPSKNGAMGLLCAALLNDGKTILHNIPQIEEVKRLLEVYESVGIKVKWTSKNTLEIDPPKVFQMDKIDVGSAGKIRSALMMIGALVHKLPKFNLPHAGGCKMGNRTIAAHRYALEELGVKIKTKEDCYEITGVLMNRKTLNEAVVGPGDQGKDSRGQRFSVSQQTSREIILYESSDTAAENALICSALFPGKTTIRFAPPNYQVQDVCFFLENCGVRVEGIGTTTLVVHGVGKIDKTLEHYNSEDPIETMMFISAAIATSSNLTITHCPIRFLELELYKLEKMGLKYKKSKEYFSQNGRTVLVDLEIKKSTLTAPLDKLHAQPYPGINADNLPFFVPICAMSSGRTLINDWMWENRAIYFTELNRLGGNVVLLDPHRVFVYGPTQFKAAQIVCPPALRPAVIIMIAMLAAKGTSVLRNIYSITRGYEDIAERLNSIGASIKVIA